MAAKFYTDAELRTARARAVEIAADGVASFYSDVGSNFGRALFFTYLRFDFLGTSRVLHECVPPL